jgi:uncharacterized protein (DUF4415 family)
MTDKDIDYSDIPALDKSFFTRATVEWAPAKQQVTVRLDKDILDWLKGYGKGYQTRINRILRAVMDSPAAALESAEENARSRGGFKPA